MSNKTRCVLTAQPGALTLSHLTSKKMKKFFLNFKFFQNANVKKILLFYCSIVPWVTPKWLETLLVLAYFFYLFCIHITMYLRRSFVSANVLVSCDGSSIGPIFRESVCMFVTKNVQQNVQQKERKRETKLDLENFEKKNKIKNSTLKVSTSIFFKMQMWRKFYCSIVLLFYGPHPNDFRLRNLKKFTWGCHIM